jgi:hypothetical protein
MLRYLLLVAPQLPRRWRETRMRMASSTRRASGARRRYALFSLFPHFFSFIYI